MEDKVYVIGSLNKLLIQEGDHFYLADSMLGAKTLVDAYQYSHLRAINPELKEISFDNGEDSTDKLFIESTLQKSLTQTLELMDPSFSDVYKTKISSYLIEKVNIHSGLIDFLSNRLYSNHLSETFSPESALYYIADKSPKLESLYRDLRIKTDYFDKFYTLFRLETNFESFEQKKLDVLLTQNGSYSNITLSLFNKSAEAYDLAAEIASNAIVNEYSILNIAFFEKLKARLKSHYHIALASTLSDKLLSTERITVRPHKFYGCPIKTIYNFNNEQLPFTEDQVKNTLNNYFHYDIKEESPIEFKCRLYDQIVDEISFISVLLTENSHFKLNEPFRQNKWMHFSTISNSINEVYAKTDTRDYYFSDDHFEMLLLADNSFINHNYESSISLYESIINYYINPRSWNVEDIMIFTSLGIKLGVSHAMLRNYPLASNILISVSEKLYSYLGDHNIQTFNDSNAREQMYSNRINLGDRLIQKLWVNVCNFIDNGGRNEWLSSADRIEVINMLKHCKQKK